MSHCDRRRDTRKEFKPCSELCPDGEACCLRGDVPHTLCICSDKHCACHSAARYQLALQARTPAQPDIVFVTDEREKQEA